MWMRRLILITVMLVFVLLVLKVSAKSSSPSPAPEGSVGAGFWDFGDYIVRIQNPSLQSLKQFNEKSTERGLIIEFWYKEPLEAGRLHYFTSCPSEIHYLSRGFDEEFDKYKYLIIVVPRPECYDYKDSDFLFRAVLLSKPEDVPGKPYKVMRPERGLFRVKIPYSVLFSNSTESTGS